MGKHSSTHCENTLFHNRVAGRERDSERETLSWTLSRVQQREQEYAAADISCRVHFAPHMLALTKEREEKRRINGSWKNDEKSGEPQGKHAVAQWRCGATGDARPPTDVVRLVCAHYGCNIKEFHLRNKRLKIPSLTLTCCYSLCKHTQTHFVFFFLLLLFLRRLFDLTHPEGRLASRLSLLSAQELSQL